jgi:paraquat-inducible protein B
MSAEHDPPVFDEELPEVTLERRRGPSIVWIVPLVAALIGGWIAYQTISHKGPTITISFTEGTGLEAGKTKVKYKALEVGVVKTIEFSADLSRVEVTASMHKDFETHLTAGTRFWVVRPRVGLGGVSGLETLVSGSYVELEPGPPGKLALRFTGLETPPVLTANTPGRQFVLRSDRLGSLQHGSPVSFRDIQVGEVLGTELAEDNESVLIHVFVKTPYDHLVRDDTQFWKASGIDVSLGADGLNVRMESLASLVAGGVAFDTPAAPAGSHTPSADGTQFQLYESYASVGESLYTQKLPFVIYFGGSVRGLSTGAPVELRGIKVGTVKDVRIEIDPETTDVRIPVVVELEPQRLTQGQHHTPKADPYKVVERLVQRGLRAQLRNGNLLTGQLFVDLSFHPETPIQRTAKSGPYPELPTIPSPLDELTNTATSVLAEIRRLPLQQIADELLGTVQGANRLLNAPELLATLRSLDTALKGVQQTSGSMDRQFQALSSSAQQTLSSARSALEVLGPDSPVPVKLTNAMDELAAAAHSLRVLGDYLERHPEALLRGKSGYGD